MLKIPAVVISDQSVDVRGTRTGSSEVSSVRDRLEPICRLALR